MYAANKTNVVTEMVERGIPLRLAIFITLPFQVVILDYLLMPLFSILFHKWLTAPQMKVGCARSLLFREWFELLWCDHSGPGSP